MDQKKASKISEIVRLQQILKKWRRLANAPKPSGSKSIKFLKRTLSFSDSSSESAVSSEVVPKGFLAVSVGEEMKRFIIPTEYLGHRAFGLLLREAEEEFGFQQEGVLRIPCEVSVFVKLLELVEEKSEIFCAGAGRSQWRQGRGWMLFLASRDMPISSTSKAHM